MNTERATTVMATALLSDRTRPLDFNSTSIVVQILQAPAAVRCRRRRRIGPSIDNPD
jgi:hypothetical protein